VLNFRKESNLLKWTQREQKKGKDGLPAYNLITARALPCLTACSRVSSVGSRLDVVDGAALPSKIVAATSSFLFLRPFRNQACVHPHSPSSALPRGDHRPDLHSPNQLPGGDQSYQKPRRGFPGSTSSFLGGSTVGDLRIGSWISPSEAGAFLRWRGWSIQRFSGGAVVGSRGSKPNLCRDLANRPF
jgi:hypothetical protein